MKAKILALLALFLLSTACRKEDDPQQPVQQNIYLTKLTAPSYIDSFAYDGNNRVVTFTRHYSAPNTDQVYSYSDFNSFGKPTKATYTYTGSPNSNVVFTYDSSGRLTKEEYFNPTTNALENYYTYTYNSSGLDTITEYSSANVIGYKWVYTQSGGNTTSITKYNSANVQQYKNSYTSFDSKNSEDKFYPDHMKTHLTNNITAYSFTMSSTTNYTVAYDYNPENFPTKKTTTNLTTNNTTVVTYDYIKK